MPADIQFSGMNNNERRLAFLIVEPEPSQNLSTRKLLLESAKHTVINAFGQEEGLQLFKRFPNIDAVIIDSDMNGWSRVAKRIREHSPNIPLVCLDSRIGAKSSWGNKTVSSHDPAALLKMLEEMGGRTDI